MDAVQCVLAGAMAHEVVCVSENVAREQHSRFLVRRRKLHTVHNSVDIEAIQREAERPVEDPAFRALRENSDFLIITAGRFVEQKGHLHLLKVFRRLTETFPGIGLVILGDGMLRQEYEAFLKQHGLEDRVLMPGFMKEPFRWLGEADCVSGARELLAPGTDIGIHTDRVEYAEYGILTAPLSGFPERSHWERGEEALRAAVSRMIRDRKLREHYREKSLQRCRAFSPERNYAEWKEIITKYQVPDHADS